MDDIVRKAFSRTMSYVSEELVLMPLSRWNESVFRYFFGRSLSETDPGVTQFVECDRIDLVLHRAEERAFIEFKFYLHALKFDPYTGGRSGVKGGPGRKNLEEFRRSIEQLHVRQPTQGLSKYIVLAYADPIGGGTTGNRYSTHYDDYAHWNGEIALDLLESVGPLESGGDRIQARLFAVR